MLEAVYTKELFGKEGILMLVVVPVSWTIERSRVYHISCVY